MVSSRKLSLLEVNTKNSKMENFDEKAKATICVECDSF